MTRIDLLQNTIFNRTCLSTHYQYLCMMYRCPSQINCIPLPSLYKIFSQPIDVQKQYAWLNPPTNIPDHHNFFLAPILIIQEFSAECDIIIQENFHQKWHSLSQYFCIVAKTCFILLTRKMKHLFLKIRGLKIIIINIS